MYKNQWFNKLENIDLIDLFLKLLYKFDVLIKIKQIMEIEENDLFAISIEGIEL